jgi:hypothetical protein
MIKIAEKQNGIFLKLILDNDVIINVFLPSDNNPMYAEFIGMETITDEKQKRQIVELFETALEEFLPDTGARH